MAPIAHSMGSVEKECLWMSCFCWTKKAVASATLVGPGEIVELVRPPLSGLILMFTAVCSGGCLNGGSCFTPGACYCRRGYSGPNCQSFFFHCFHCHDIVYSSTEAARCSSTVSSLCGEYCPSNTDQQSSEFCGGLNLRRTCTTRPAYYPNNCCPGYMGSSCQTGSKMYLRIW